MSLCYIGMHFNLKNITKAVYNKTIPILVWAIRIIKTSLLKTFSTYISAVKRLQAMGNACPINVHRIVNKFLLISWSKM